MDIDVPEGYLTKGGGVIRVLWPFLAGDGWTLTSSIIENAQALKVTRLSKEYVFVSDYGELDLTGGRWKALVGDRIYCIGSSTSSSSADDPIAVGDGVRLRVSDSQIEKIVLTNPEGYTFPLDVPKMQGDQASTNKPIQLKQNDSTWVDVTGKDLSTIASAEADHIPLKFRFPPDAKAGEPKTKVQVQLTRDVTGKPGNLDITLMDGTGKVLSVVHVQITCVACNAKDAATGANPQK